MKIDINLSHRNEYKKENNINTINIYEKLISNLQPMIQSQDNKISFFISTLLLAYWSNRLL